VKIVAAAILLASGLAVAQTVDPEPPPPPHVSVAVGKTQSVNVGWARGGWFCDDTSLVKGDLVTRKVGNDETNFWVITGVKVGKTQCRIGDDPNRTSIVFDLSVTPAPKK
jgi:hypothetical protein